MTNMWKTSIVIVSLALLLPDCNRAADIEQEKNDVQQVLEKYVESVKTADVKIASQVWLQSEDISVVAPFGRFKGWENVRDGLYVNFLQKAFVERNLKPDNIAITVTGN